MAIRHVTCIDNVDSEGFLIDPTRTCHGTIRAAHIEDLGGPVDPLTHLNRDFAEHELGECVVAEELEIGSPLVPDADGQFQRAVVHHSSMKSLGRVDIGRRRVEWLQAFKDRRTGTANAHR